MSNTQTIFLAIVCLALGLGAGWFLSDTGTNSTGIKIKFGDSEVDINLDAQEIDAITLLDSIFSDDYEKLGPKKWLEENQGLYEYGDSRLVPLIATLDFDHPSSVKLRELRDAYSGPFAEKSQDVVLGFPGDSLTTPGKANGCATGPVSLLGRTVEIYQEGKADKAISLKVSGTYECKYKQQRDDGSYRYPNLQISPQDAKKLFGTSNMPQYTPVKLIVLRGADE